MSRNHVESVKVAHFTQIGRRPYQEDVFLVSHPFYAILDGHNGREAAEFIASLLPETLQMYLDMENVNESTPLEALQTCIANAFIDLDEQLKESLTKTETWPGTTCTVACLEPPFIANIGDSTAILVPANGPCQELTVTDSPDSPTERARVQRCGGEIRDGRLGQLAMTRAFGDFELKSIGLSVDPHVARLPRGTLVLASDGLWDVMGNEEVAAVVRRKRGNLKHVVELLEKEVWGRADDNVTVLLVDFL